MKQISLTFQVWFWSLIYRSNGNVAKTEIGIRYFFFPVRPEQVVWQEFVEVCGPLDWKTIEDLKLNGLFCRSLGGRYAESHMIGPQSSEGSQDY